MKGKVMILKLLAVFWICCSSIWAAPVESEKGKDEFVFLLPATGNGGLIVPGLSVNLEPPLASIGAFRNSRDSYGNPVPPYTAIESGNRVQSPQGWNFEIPSYASGITEIRKPTNELLPPLVSGIVPVDALLTPAVIQPSIELLPPLKDDEVPGSKKDVITNEIPERPEEITTVKPESDDNKDHENETPDKQPEDKKYPGVKYTGGFGGPPGILGDQKEKGYAIKEKEEREKEEAAAAATEQSDEEHTEASPQSEASPSEEKTPETAASTPLPSLGFNSVFSSSLPPVKLANTSQTIDEPSEQHHGTERGSPHTEANPLATSSTFSPPLGEEPLSSYGSSTLQQPIPSLSSPKPEGSIPQTPNQVQQPTPLFGAPTPPQPTSIFAPTPNLPQSPNEPQQPTPSFGSPTPQQSIPIFAPTTNLPQSPNEPQQPTPSIGSPTPQNSIPIFAPTPDLPQSPNEPQQPTPSFGSPTPQNSIPIFAPTPDLPQSPNEPQQPTPSFGSPTPQNSIPIFAPTPDLPQSPNESQQPALTSESAVAQQPISNINFPSPTVQQFPIFGAPLSVPSIPERFDGSENPQGQSAFLPLPISTLTQPNPIPNILTFAPVPIPSPQPQPELPPSIGIKTNVPGKYTGGFGGAPGVLGNQAKPGYAVLPNGSIKDPDHTYKPPQPIASEVTTSTTTTTTKAPVIVTPITKYDKYTGGFGGPPGVLKPFDNKH